MSRVLVAILAVAAAIAVVGAGLLLLDEWSAPPIVISDPVAGTRVAVSVEGAVARPGVYELPADARYADAIAAAGGLVDDADLAAYNPARRIRDEDRIVVPRLGAPTSEAVPTPRRSTPPPAEPRAAGQGQPIDINTATADELDALPGIGPALAARIVTARDERGPFASVDDLAAVEGISPRMVDDLRSLVTVGP